jgi:hypothetical protein
VTALLAESVLVPVLMAGPMLAGCCWLLWCALGSPLRAAAAHTKRWLQRHETGAAIAAGAVAVSVIGAILVRGTGSPSDDLVEALVIREDLPILSLLDDSAIQSHIGRVRVPRDRLPAGAVLDERLVVGKWTLRTLRAGEYLIGDDVGHPCICLAPDASHMAEVRLGADARGADRLKPEERVDLFVGVRVGGGRVTSVPVLDRLLVLSTSWAEETGGALRVAVTPAEAEAIRAAEYRGDLRAVRSARAE